MNKYVFSVSLSQVCVDFLVLGLGICVVLNMKK